MTNQELLRFEHVTKVENGISLLDDLSLVLLAGERVQITGLSGCGMEELGRILAGQTTFDAGRVLFNGKCYSPGALLPVGEMGIFSSFGATSIVPQMTVAENIFLLRKNRLMDFTPSRRLVNRQAAELLAEFGLSSIPPDIPAQALSLAEQTCLEFLKAYARNAKLIVAHGVSGPYPEAQERIFEGVNRKLHQENIGVLAISASPSSDYDRTIIMRDGTRSKTLYHQLRTRGDIMRYAVSGELPEPAPRKCHTEDRFAFRCFGLSLGQVRDLNFGVRRGEIVGIYDPESSDLALTLEALLTGAARPEGGYMLLGGGDFSPRDLSHAVARGLGYIRGENLENQLIEHMTVLENVLLSSLKKAPKALAFRNRAVEREVQALLEEGDLRGLSSLPIREMPEGDSLSKVTILYHRWGVYRPKLLLYSDPFAHTDAVLRLRILERIEHLTSLSLGVLVLAPRIQDLVYLCDRILVYKKGHFVREHHKQDNQFPDLNQPYV